MGSWCRLKYASLSLSLFSSVFIFVFFYRFGSMKFQLNFRLGMAWQALNQKHIFLIDNENRNRFSEANEIGFSLHTHSSGQAIDVSLR